jgi:O-antigen ligase
MIKPIPREIDYWILLLGMVVIRIPVVFGFNQSSVFRLLTIFPFIFVISKNAISLFTNQTIIFNKKIFVLLLIYLNLLAVAVLRSLFAKSFPIVSTLGNFSLWITFVLFGFFVFIHVSNQKKEQAYQKAIAYSIILFVVVNIMAYYFGLSNQEELYVTSRPAVMLRYFGISTDRVLFPLVSGINTFGIIAGAALCISIILLSNHSQKGDKVIGIIGLLFSAYGILLTDCRGALFFAAVTIFTSLFFPTRFVKLFCWLPLFAPLLPFIYIFIQENIPYWVIQGLLRTPFLGNVDILSGRGIIWKTIIDHYSDFQFIHLFGYGYHGEAISGLSAKYSYLFTNFINSDWITVHNYFLQTLLEIGYLGLILMVWFITTITTRLASMTVANPGDNSAKILFYLMFYFILAGTTETVLSTYHLELFYIFLLIISAVGAAPAVHSLPQKNGKGSNQKNPDNPGNTSRE